MKTSRNFQVKLSGSLLAGLWLLLPADARGDNEETPHTEGIEKADKQAPTLTGGHLEQVNAPATAKKVVGKPPDRQQEETNRRALVCPAGVGALPVTSPEGLAIYRIARDGKLTIPKSFAVSQVAVAVEGKTDLVMRVDSTDRSGATKNVFCVLAKAGEAYSVVPAGRSLEEEGSTLSVQLFDEPTLDEVARSKRLVEAGIDSIVAELQVEERNQVHRALGLRARLNAVRANLPLHPDIAHGQIQAALKATEPIALQFTCDALDAKGPPLAYAICSELGRVANQLTALDAIVQAAVAAPAQLVSGRIGDALEAIALPGPISDATRARHCRGAQQLRWLRSAKALRLIARAQIPLVDSEHLFHTAYGANVEDVDSAPTDGALALMVTGAPSSKPGSFMTRRGNVVTTDVATLLTKFLPVALGGLPGSFPKSRFTLAMDPDLTPKNTDSLQSLVCKAGDDKQLAVDLGPVAENETRSYVFGPLTKKYGVDVVACEGQQCSAAADDKAAKSRVSITPSQSGTLALLAEFSFNFGVWSSRGGDGRRESLGLSGQTAPAFHPIEGVAGTEQLFQMRQDVDPRNAFSTALLLGVKLGKRCFVGAGPSLLVGASGAILKQWNAHLGVRVAPNTYFTLGPSVRFVPQPDFYRIGDVVGVPLPMSGSNATSPQVSTHQVALWQFDVGLAFDLAGAATALSSFGGK